MTIAACEKSDSLAVVHPLCKGDCAKSSHSGQAFKIASNSCAHEFGGWGVFRRHVRTQTVQPHVPETQTGGNPSEVGTSKRGHFERRAPTLALTD